MFDNVPQSDTPPISNSTCSFIPQLNTTV